MHHLMEDMLVKITSKPISPEEVIKKATTTASGCVVTYVGLIRDNARDKQVLAVEYQDPEGDAESKLRQIASEALEKWQLNKVALVHRLGKLKVGEINLVICVASAHRQEGFAASKYLVDRFKEVMPARKKETYTDGTAWTPDE